MTLPAYRIPKLLYQGFTLINPLAFPTSECVNTEVTHRMAFNCDYKCTCREETGELVSFNISLPDVNCLVKGVWHLAHIFKGLVPAEVMIWEVCGCFS